MGSRGLSLGLEMGLTRFFWDEACSMLVDESVRRVGAEEEGKVSPLSPTSFSIVAMVSSTFSSVGLGSLKGCCMLTSNFFIKELPLGD